MSTVLQKWEGYFPVTSEASRTSGVEGNLLASLRKPTLKTKSLANKNSYTLSNLDPFSAQNIHEEMMPKR